MATVMNSHSHHLTTPRTLTQKVCIGLGIFFVLAGLGGIVMPGMLGMHLSLLHNVIHLLSGIFAIWCGYSDDTRKSYNFCVGFGVVYGILGLAGFVFGEPGYPGVGHMEADENLFRIIPNALEFGTADHTVHILIATAFLVSAYIWKKRTDSIARTTVDTQGRTFHRDTVHTPSDVFRTTGRIGEVPDSESGLADADLGRSDINRQVDRARRSEFERRI